MNGLAFAKGAYRVQNKNGKIVTSFNALPPSVLFVERAALVDHMITEIGRLEPDRSDPSVSNALKIVESQACQSKALHIGIRIACKTTALCTAAEVCKVYRCKQVLENGGLYLQGEAPLWPQSFQN